MGVFFCCLRFYLCVCAVFTRSFHSSVLTFILFHMSVSFAENVHFPPVVSKRDAVAVAMAAYRRDAYELNYIPIPQRAGYVVPNPHKFYTVIDREFSQLLPSTQSTRNFKNRLDLLNLQVSELEVLINFEKTLDVEKQTLAPLVTALDDVKAHIKEFQATCDIFNSRRKSSRAVSEMPVGASHVVESQMLLAESSRDNSPEPAPSQPRRAETVVCTPMCTSI